MTLTSIEKLREVKTHTHTYTHTHTTPHLCNLPSPRSKSVCSAAQIPQPSGGNSVPDRSGSGQTPPPNPPRRPVSPPGQTVRHGMCYRPVALATLFSSFATLSSKCLSPTNGSVGADSPHVQKTPASVPTPNVPQQEDIVLLALLPPPPAWNRLRKNSSRTRAAREEPKSAPGGRAGETERRAQQKKKT